MTTPAITVPAVTAPTVAGTTAPPAPGHLFAGLLTALTTTTAAPAPAAKVAVTPEPDTAPPLDPASLTATALATATVAPVLLPDPAPPAPATSSGERAPVHKALAPGQGKAAGTCAKELAPGHVKAGDTSAKEVAPGHRVEVASATPEVAVVAPPVTAPEPVTTPVPVSATEPTHTVRPAIAAAAKRLTHQGDRTSLVVRLDPPELGAVLVRMTVREGQVEVTLRAPDLAAQGGLLAQAPEIQQVLKEAGLDLTSFDVSYGELAQGQSQEHRETPDRGTPRQRGGADGTVHVTDDVTDPQPAGTWL